MDNVGFLLISSRLSEPAIIPKDWREALLDVRCSAQDPGEISGPDRGPLRGGKERRRRRRRE